MVAMPGQLFSNTQIPACLWFLSKDKKPGGNGRIDRSGQILFIDARKAASGRISRTQVEFTDEDLQRIAQTYHRWRGTKFAVPPLPSEDGRGESAVPPLPSEEGRGEPAVPPLPPAEEGRGEPAVPPLPLAGEGRGEGKPCQAVEPLSPRERGRGEGSAYANVPGFCYSASLAEVEKQNFVLTPGRYVGAVAEDDDDEAFAEKMERLTAQLAEQMAKGAELDAVIREKLGALGYGV
jgi:type I restriction enzyme M protein